MNSMPIKHVHRVRNRHGKLYYYHRPTGKRIEAAWGTPEFLEEVKALNGQFEAKQVAKGGTLREVFDEYRTTPAWLKDKAHATRVGYEKYFDLAGPLQKTPVRLITTPMLVTMRDKLSMKRGARTANYVRSVISVVMGYAVEKGYVPANPAKDLKPARREKDLKAANRPWTIEEANAVIDEAPWSIKVPLAIAMYTGLRKADALALEKGERLGDAIRTSKTGEEVTILIHPELRAILDGAPKHGAKTLAANQGGQTWTSSGFDSVWDKFKRRLEREGKVDPGLTMHGLRHTVGGMLADAGCDLDTIRRVLGQKTLTMAQLYSERAKKRAATQEAMGRIDPRGMQMGRAAQAEEAGELADEGV